MSTTTPPDGLLTAAQAAAILGVPPAAIKDWKHHGRVVPAGMLRGRGRGGLQPLYRLAELEPLAATYLDRVARRAGRSTEDGPEL